MTRAPLTKTLPGGTALRTAAMARISLPSGAAPFTPAGTVMNITCGGAYHGSDKTFQFNGRGEMRISNFYAANAGKLVRSCGDCTNNGGPRRIDVNNVITRDVSTIVGINSNFGDVATTPGYERCTCRICRQLALIYHNHRTLRSAPPPDATQPISGQELARALQSAPQSSGPSPLPSQDATRLVVGPQRSRDRTRRSAVGAVEHLRQTCTADLCPGAF